jgi:quercetin dioxygenase-like cupin family protein
VERFKKIDPARFSIAVSRDLHMLALELKPGPPARPDGLSIGVADMTRAPPHGGELHPDGDELIYVISGKVRVLGESSSVEPCELGPGEMCIVPQGTWHRLQLVEPTRLIHVTPGPRGEHRPVGWVSGS